MKPKLCILTTIPLSIKSFYKGQLEALQQAGFQVAVVCAKEEDFELYLPEGVQYYPIPFTRTISPLSSFKSLIYLIRLFRKERFEIIQYSTPNASLLSSIAGFVARIPIRIYILWGLYYEGQKGIKRKLFKGFEKLVCRLSHKIIPISHEMVDWAISEGLGTQQQYTVILHGSACGVNLDQFDSDKWKDSRAGIRDQYQIPENSVVIGTVARLTGDKGINELVQAFDHLSKEVSGIYLLLVGAREDKDLLSSQTESIIRKNLRIRLAGWQDNPLPFYAAMDIFCLPTYREGFGEVNLEAQAMGLPVVSTDIIGPRESIEPDITGFLVSPKSVEAVYDALKKLISNKTLREDMGQRGRERVRQKFDRREMIKAVVQHRLSLLKDLNCS